MNSGHVPSHSLEHEQVLLGAILIDPSKLDDVREILIAEDFYVPAYAEIFRSMVILDDTSAPIEPFAIGEELKRRGKSGLVGCLAELAAEGLPSQAIRAAETVKGLAEIREIERLTQAINAECREAQPRSVVEFEEFKNRVEQRIFDACERRTHLTIERAGDLVEAARERFAGYARHETPDSTSLIARLAD